MDMAQQLIALVALTENPGSRTYKGAYNSLQFQFQTIWFHLLALAGNRHTFTTQRIFRKNTNRHKIKQLVFKKQQKTLHTLNTDGHNGAHLDSSSQGRWIWSSDSLGYNQSQAGTSETKTMNTANSPTLF